MFRNTLLAAGLTLTLFSATEVASAQGYRYGRPIIVGRPVAPVVVHPTYRVGQIYRPVPVYRPAPVQVYRQPIYTPNRGLNISIGIGSPVYGPSMYGRGYGFGRYPY